MILFSTLLGIWVLIILIGLWAACIANLLHFKNAVSENPVDPLIKMTLIRPIKGLNDGMRQALESVAKSDLENRLQILIAIETETDPAYPIAIEFARSKKEKDISVILTGPSQNRMGKIHNMIEALPHAKNSFVIFSDADAWASPTLIEETARAFSNGFDAIFALPYFLEPRNWAERSFAIALNHGFSMPAALSYHALNFPFTSGAWMGFSREALQKIGGLKPLEHQIADAYALGSAVLKTGGKCFLVNRPVFFKETTQNLKDTASHLSKWAAIIHSCLPRLYPFALFLSPIHAALFFLTWAMIYGKEISLAASLLIVIVVSRIMTGFIEDLKIARQAMPLYAYLAIPLIDLAETLVWVSGFRKTIEWRNKRYRLFPGGRSEVIGEKN